MMLRTLLMEFKPNDYVTIINKRQNVLFTGKRSELIYTIGDKFLNLRCKKVELPNGVVALQVVPRFKERWLNK